MMRNQHTQQPLQQTGNVLIYQTEAGSTHIEVFFRDGNVWMAQKALSELYQVRVATINYHIKSILDEGELSETTIRNYRIVQEESGIRKERNIKHYDFQMILAIGYRVRSHVGIHFRNWASHVLTEYAQKGFAMNDERLKNPQHFGEDYFDELLERIRDIRASEKRFYRKIADLYTLSVDYDPASEQAQRFFAHVQNKMHYSVTRHTAAELIAGRADAAKPNMGLTSFKGTKVRKQDVTIAKNYLSEPEISELNRIVTMYLDYAEDQAKRRIVMHMSDWETKLDAFMRFNERELLTHQGRISAEAAKEHALKEYALYDDHRNTIEGADDLPQLLSKAKVLKQEKKP